MIESLSNSKVKYAMKLKQKKYREAYKEFLVEGYHLVEEAMKAGLAKTIFTTGMETFADVDTFMVTEPVMQKLSELNEKKGIVAICHRPETRFLSSNVLLLDQIQDPGNMGTLIRSAAAFGFQTIIADCSVDFYNEKVIRASQGAIFYVDLREDDILDFIKHHSNYHFYGTDVLQGTDVRDIDFSSEQCAIILGNEGSGVREEIKNLVNTNIMIPMLDTESLNVAIAGGILMFEAFRRK